MILRRVARDYFRIGEKEPEGNDEELEQLLKNLKLRRMLSVYDEQLQAAEKAQIPYTSSWPDCCGRSGTSGRRVHSNGAFNGRICRSDGRWRRFRGRASRA